MSMSGVRLGINLMAWSGMVGPAELALLPRLAALGYDGVELPLLEPDQIDAGRVRAALVVAGLACTASGALPRGASLLDPAERERGVAWLDRCLAVAAACGATLLCGPLYAPVGVLPGRPPTPAEWESCVLGLRAAGERAAVHGVRLAIEPLNRFETHFLNTAADGLGLLAAVDSAAVGLHLDTFHMNIEEQNLAAAVQQAEARLMHVHFSANDRGIVGSGHIDWTGVRDALRAAGYDRPEGWVVAETFTGTVAAIAAATAVWRPLVPDPWTYAAESLTFMRRLFGDG
jgi:D-psicose/D-tagatose/L-ribulose 3-epimerase